MAVDGVVKQSSKDSDNSASDEKSDKPVVPKPQPLKFVEGDPKSNWRNFKEEWNAYENGSGLKDKASTEKVITFLRVLGKDALNVYNSFQWENRGDARDIDKVIEKFEDLCLSEKSSRFQRYLFYKREQDAGEKLEDYVKDVKAMAVACNFGTQTETMIGDKIIFGLNDSMVKEEMLRMEDLNIDTIVSKTKEMLALYDKKTKEQRLKIWKIKENRRVGKITMAEEVEMLEELNGAEADHVDDDDGDAIKVEDEIIFTADQDDDVKDDDDDDEEEDEKRTSKFGESEKKELDAQTRRDREFTSEDFKIEIKGLPSFYSKVQLTKLLNETLQLKAHKIKPGGPHTTHAFVTFRDEKSRQRALAVLDDYKWKKNKLTAVPAAALEDPVVKKEKDKKEEPDPDAHLPINERVYKSCTPYATLEYKEQLEKKNKAAQAAMRKFGNEMARTNVELRDWVRFHKLRRKGQVCEMLDIIPSPVTDGYRNKCEFTVGINPETEVPCVGFRVGKYKDGCVSVGPVEHLIHIDDTMKKVAKSFEEYVCSSDHKPFNPVSHEGVWRQLNVRTSTNNDVMIAVVIHPQEFSDVEISDIKQSVIDYFVDGDGEPCGVTSLYFQSFGQQEPGPEDVKYEHIWGDKYMTETVSGKNFRVSCESFFQVNTKGCEVLYETISDLAELDGTSVILDICCGTGTIGCSLADQCLKVYGVEMVSQAAEDARNNAHMNALDNVAVYTGKAEVNMNAVLAQCVKYNTVGVVDPPRAGLSESVIRSLRKCDNMNRLIYISCDPEAAFKNFIDLSRPKSKQYKGEFFVPVKAAVVDMFPHTPHYELLIVFERWEERKWRRIMEGNPLPRDEEYFKRIPAKPEGAVDSDSDNEEGVPRQQETGMGTWKSIRRGRRDNYQPYPMRPQQYDNYNDSGYGPMRRGGAGLMGSNPYEDEEEYGGDYDEGGYGGGMGNRFGGSGVQDRFGGGGGISDRFGGGGMSDRFGGSGMSDRFGGGGMQDRFGGGNVSERFGGNNSNYSGGSGFGGGSRNFDSYYNDQRGQDPYRLSRDDLYQPFSRRGNTGGMSDSYRGGNDRFFRF